MEFEKKGYIRFTDEIEEWGELMDHCDKNWVKGGLFCLFTIVMKHTSLSSKIRPAADLKRNGPMGWSLNDFAQAGSSQFSMVEFAILSCLFPHFSTSDHANYYNSMHLDKIQWPTMQILIPPADGSLNPANWRKACLTRGWYGHISMSLFCIMAKEEIMKQMNLSDDVDFSSFDEFDETTMEEISNLFENEEHGDPSDTHMMQVEDLEPGNVQSNSHSDMMEDTEPEYFEECISSPFDNNHHDHHHHHHRPHSSSSSSSSSPEMSTDEEETFESAEDLDEQIQKSMKKLVQSMHRSEMSRNMLGRQQSAGSLFGLGSFMNASRLASGIAQSRSQLNSYMNHMGSNSTM